MATDANIRIDEWEDAWIPQAITAEAQEVVQFENGRYGITLNEIPYRTLPFVLEDSPSGGLVFDEVSVITAPGANEYRLPPRPKFEYSPRVEMHISRLGETVYATYYGLGSANNARIINQVIRQALSDFRGMAAYTSGSGNWTCPADVGSALVIVIGGGAGGENNPGGSGGGAGGVAVKMFTGLTPGTDYAYAVGSGGGAGSNGGNSTFTAGVTITGAGGVSSGAGGTGTNGDLNFTLGNGKQGKLTVFNTLDNARLGGDGGGFGGGSGAGLIFDYGTPGSPTAGVNATAGTGIGSGGGGYRGLNGVAGGGAAGSNGAVIIIY